MIRRLGPPLAAVLALSGLAACSDGSSPADTETAAAANRPADEVQEVAWEKVATPDECRCSDGSEFHYWQHEGDPAKVLFVLEGGGACFSAETCGSADGTSKPSLASDLADEPGYVYRDGTPTPATRGLVDVGDPANPLFGYSVVFVPYCTGDLHLGDNTQDYGGGVVVVEHKGRVNATTALEGMAASFPDAEQVVVLGFSAGSAGAPLYGGLAHDLLPDADIKVISDGSGAYPGDELITGAIGGLWGIFGNLPQWPESAGEPQSAWSLPGLFVQAGRHVPGIGLATIDTAEDEVQREFTELIGFGDTPLLELITDNHEYIEGNGVELSSWVGPGDQHVSTAGDDVLYGSEVEGTELVDWIGDFLAGEDVDDVRCPDCA
ncbi:pectin acetylesterase-family hydrolase [Blastococcus goldschmidtiae]|uniref:Pectin acetylesterase-family hydrolase n=1 Tax=Blastococcus goldschmidtiae TaxID=3075546 RepID=A0ABU2K8B1_9ACTN|nr:pectin acetylesterase-family hydrolase [Blastococcus sp. DSM 46792]MDT0276403.1 pectin acetylesterase-family hydrolase [Blastococcus sp. DSM 46792]